MRVISAVAAPTKRSTAAEWRGPIGLIILGLVPALAGTVRVVQLAVGVEETPDNARFVGSPGPVVLHVIAVVIFSFAGALQFAPTLRRGRQWHQRAGWAIVGGGIVAAASGAWMTHAYALPASDNELLGVYRYVFAGAMAGSLILAVFALRARKFARHGAWMTRGYAIGLGAGTQVFTTIAWLIPFGKPTPLVRSSLMLAGWLINVVVAERVIRKRASANRHRRPLTVA